jgi:hypothetical protein
MFERLDRNGDGVISKDEMPEGGRGEGRGRHEGGRHDHRGGSHGQAGN